MSIENFPVVSPGWHYFVLRGNRPMKKPVVDGCETVQLVGQPGIEPGTYGLGNNIPYSKIRGVNCAGGRMVVKCLDCLCAK